MNPSKLNEIIGGGFRTEADVKYFFTELRSLIEHLGFPPEYHTVKFYCDWMLHTKKNNLKDMYEYFIELNDILNKSEILLAISHQVKLHIEKLTSFSILKKELLALLNKYGIKTSFILDNQQWIIFKVILQKLILNRPIDFDKIELNTPKRRILRFVVTDSSPMPLPIKGTLYWMIILNTSTFPMVGVIRESIGVY